MSHKRPRSDSQASLSQPEAFTTSAEPTPKAVRTALPVVASSSAPLLCTLPPTCNPPHNRPTPIGNSTELESHYAKYHAHVCEDHSCGCVFPDARLLELHQTECHDPIAAVRKERGEKIFACHLASCTRRFLTPKARRLHLIQGHGYPKEYFFAVTNKGVGGLLKKWGDGASMIRGQWKPRERMEDGEDEESESEGDTTETEGDTPPTTQRLPIDEDLDEPAGAPRAQHKADDAVQGLTGALNALSLVPSNVKFGRGGSTGGFRQGAARGKLAPGIIPVHDNPLLRRGFGRGRARARVGTGAIGRGAAVVSGAVATGSQGGAPTIEGAMRGSRGASRGRGGTRGRGRGS